MPDRLDDLRRQRALVQEQLAWLDREIAALTPGAPAPAAAPVVPVDPSAPTPAAKPAPAVGDLPDYQPDPVAAHNETRRGCLLFSAIGFALLAAAVVAIYYFGYRDHPIFFADRPAAKSPAP